jgi:putative transcriptional regulator
MIRHHPDSDMLADYAGGKLHHGAMLVVACHLESCALCRQEISVWECAGGALLEDAAPVALSAAALDKMMARLAADEKPKQALPGFLSRFDIPAALTAQTIGRRRFVTPSIWFAPVAADAGEARTYLVYAKRDKVLAEHSHRGREVTHVITGAFSDGTGIYGVGDFALTDDSHTHAPTVTHDGECLCLISAEAPMRLTSFPARILQAMTGHHY